MSYEVSIFVLSPFANNFVNLEVREWMLKWKYPSMLILCWALLMIEIRVKWIENGLQMVLTYTLCTMAGALLQLAFLKRLEESSGMPLSISFNFTFFIPCLPLLFLFRYLFIVNLICWLSSLGIFSNVLVWKCGTKYHTFQQKPLILLVCENVRLTKWEVWYRLGVSEF